MNLQKPGFHVVELRKFQEISHTLISPHRTSIINLLREMERGKLNKLTVVDGLDELLKSSTDEAIVQVRKTFNKVITEMLTIGASIVFVVAADIEDIPEDPKIYKKPLALVFPRPHDINFMEPGYLYYPII